MPPMLALNVHCFTTPREPTAGRRRGVHRLSQRPTTSPAVASGAKRRDSVKLVLCAARVMADLEKPSPLDSSPGTQPTLSLQLMTDATVHAAIGLNAQGIHNLLLPGALGKPLVEESRKLRNSRLCVAESAAINVLQYVKRRGTRTAPGWNVELTPGRLAMNLTSMNLPDTGPFVARRFSGYLSWLFWNATGAGRQLISAVRKRWLSSRQILRVEGIRVRRGRGRRVLRSGALSGARRHEASDGWFALGARLHREHIDAVRSRNSCGV
jgi:hypothetical protein